MNAEIENKATIENLLLEGNIVSREIEVLGREFESEPMIDTVQLTARQSKVSHLNVKFTGLRSQFLSLYPELINHPNEVMNPNQLERAWEQLNEAIWWASDIARLDVNSSIYSLGHDFWYIIANGTCFPDNLAEAFRRGVKVGDDPDTEREYKHG